MATAGVSAVFVGASPAYAASEACGNNDGVLVAPGVCELSFTSGATTFTPTADMTKLEVLLVGAGGNGAQDTGTDGYASAAAGGGGEVKIVDLTGTTDPMLIVVPTPDALGSVTAVTTIGVANGGSPADNTYSGGTSGSSHSGSSVTVAPSEAAYGAGGGAGGIASGPDGGAGVVVGDLAPAGSLFAGDSRCFGGGGSIGFAYSGVIGAPGCGGGGPATADSLVVPTANSGGGGGSVDSVRPAAERRGADGIVIVRWAASAVSVTFDVGSHATAPAPQSLTAGTAPAAPTAPSATGFVFEGWYTDAALTTPADFTIPVASATTFYAKWSAVQVTLNYDMGGHGTAPSPVTVDYGTVVPRPAEPTAAGYTFDGWFTDAALTTRADFSDPLTASATLYASWSAVPQPAGQLSATGFDESSLAGAGALLAAGLGLVLVAGRRRRRSS